MLVSFSEVVGVHFGIQFLNHDLRYKTRFPHALVALPGTVSTSVEPMSRGSFPRSLWCAVGSSLHDSAPGGHGKEIESSLGRFRGHQAPRFRAGIRDPRDALIQRDEVVTAFARQCHLAE